MVKILALDPANRCGFAHSDGPHGAWQLDASGSEHAGARLVRLRERLEGARQVWGIDRIAYEDASFGSHNPQTQAAHNEMAGIIKLFCASHGIPFVSYNPTTIKKFATGNGHAKKDQMIAACKTILGIETSDDNVADALWILEMAKRAYVPESKQKKQVRARRKKEPKLF